MRLIDLDKAVSICDEDNNAIIFANIKNAEVKAIPIEWIEEWYKTHVYYLKEEKPIIYAYEQMIMDWGKENENRSTESIE